MAEVRSGGNIGGKLNVEPFSKPFSQILLMHRILRRDAEMDFRQFCFECSLYAEDDEEEAARLGLIENVGDYAQVKAAISAVKAYLSRTLGRMAYAQKGMLGGNQVFDEFVDVMREGFDAWSDVLAECEAHLGALEGKG